MDPGSSGPGELTSTGRRIDQVLTDRVTMLYDTSSLRVGGETLGVDGMFTICAGYAGLAFYVVMLALQSFCPLHSMNMDISRSILHSYWAHQFPIVAHQS